MGNEKLKIHKSMLQKIKRIVFLLIRIVKNIFKLFNIFYP